MHDSTIWWLATAAAVGLELMTGTFYLLMLAIGGAAAALTAHAGATTAVQFVVGAVVGCAAVVVLHQTRKRKPSDPSVRAMRSVNLDVGEMIMVEHWQPDGTANVQYRGANWTAIHRDGIVPTPGAHRVIELVGSRLLIGKVPPP